MSGYPAADKVKELRTALDELRQSDVNLRALERQYNECKANIPLARDRSAKAMSTVMALLEQMDCASTGNHGWENRFAVLLLEIDKQASAKEEEAT